MSRLAPGGAHVMRRLALPLLALAACGSDESTGTPLPAAMAPGATPAAAPVQAAPVRTTRSGGVYVPAAAPLDPAKEALLIEARRRVFRSEDFVESQHNRDPFRSFLSDLSGRAVGGEDQHKVLLDKFSLDELRLAAIVGPSGSTTAGWQAMLIDPTGFGIMVGRGDHVSRSDAKIIRIMPNRVILEFAEDLGNGQSRLRERQIELHAGESGTEPTQGDAKQ